MKLHWSDRSPFVRKVMITLHETGLLSHVELVRSIVAIHSPPNADVLADNPLGKIPVLIADSGKPLYDSRVICEYLAGVAATDLFPVEATSRMDHLCWQALGDGLTDILLLWRTELTRETGPWTALTDGWQTKVRAAMVQLERDARTLEEAAFGIGHISVICALGQLDFRWPDCAWRDHFPALAVLEATLAQRPSVKATAIAAGDVGAGAGELTAGQLTFSS